jgi:polysaccharide deacetylase family protein (PEP-CTERM system associated)
MTTPVINALTIDVEDYFHIHALSAVIRPDDWDSFEPKVEQNTYRLLDLLDSVKVQNSEFRTQNPESSRTRATFFVLGWVAERFPGLVKEINARGHEIACHGYGHQRIHTQTRQEFKEDARRAKEILENIIGNEVIGYRAPTYSINENTIWALEVLFELGFRYDSSIFPIKHDFYGLPEAPRFPFYIDFTDGDILSQFQKPKYLNDMDFKVDSHAPGSFIEFPISTIRLFRRNLPCSGGGYFRLLPYWLTKWGFKSPNERNSNPKIFYIHPWELDPEIPRINEASGLSKFRTYVNLSKTEARFKRLLSEFKFAPLATLLKGARHKVKEK